MTPNFSFEMDSGVGVPLHVPPGVFLPTYTSTLCIKAAIKHIAKECALLDLGCGCGVVGVVLAKQSFVRGPIYASDISQVAVDAARENYSLHGIAAEVRRGSVFEPWPNMRFDLVIDDVSGIAEDVAAMSPWFANNIPCATGPDGAELTLRVIEDAPAYLTDRGGIFLPVISLSNKTRILAAAKDSFEEVCPAAVQTWRLPDAMRPFLPRLRQIKDEGRISFEERFGTVLCSTEIYYCTNQRKAKP